MNAIGRLYYLPTTWDDFVGNQRAVAHFKNIVRTVRVRKRVFNFSTLLIGPPGTGKTALVRKLAQCLLCENLDGETLNSCNKCKSCVELTYIEGNDSIETRAKIDDADGVDHIFSPIDCSKRNLNIQAVLGELKTAPGSVRLAHLEEVGCLADNEKDLQLLVPMDDRGFVWVGTGMSYLGLSEAFIRRFSYKQTPALPNRDELAIWLTKRSVEQGVRCENLETMQRLADRAKLRPAYGLQLVDYARTFGDDAMITREMVEQHIFDYDD